MGVNATDGSARDEQLDLGALLEPIREDRFFTEYWERKPLVLSRANPDYYRAVLGLVDVEGIISRSDTRYPSVRLAKGGAFFPPEAYTRDVRYGDELFRGALDVQKIFAEFSSGATITLPALHQSWPPLAGLCTRLEARLDHPVHTNAYLTPAGTAGFTPHYDTHEVFVLQIAGHKRWQVYAPPLALPHRSQPFSPESYVLPGEPAMELELRAGDLLYLPRGYVHTTKTADSFSLHVTIGVNVYTWADLLAELVQVAVERTEFRSALAPGFAGSALQRGALGAQFRQLFDQLGGDLDVDALCERFVRRVQTARARTSPRFQVAREPVGPRTPLQIVPGLDYRLLREAGSVVLEIHGRRIRLQGEVQPALEAICRAERFVAEDLPATLSLPARLTLVTYLHGLGFLQPPGPP